MLAGVPQALKGRLAVAVAACALLIMASVPLGLAATQPLLTTTASGSNAQLANIGGYQGVIIDYQDSADFNISAFVYLYLSNGAGQTVYVNVGSCVLVVNQTTQCFVYVPSTVHSGTYTATLFATSSTHVPVTVSSSTQVTL